MARPGTYGGAGGTQGTSLPRCRLRRRRGYGDNPAAPGTRRIPGGRLRWRGSLVGDSPLQEQEQRMRRHRREGTRERKPPLQE